MNILELKNTDLNPNRIIPFILIFYFFPVIFGENNFAQDINADIKGEINTIFFQENFEDSDFTSRGWYDNTNLLLSGIEHIPDSDSSVVFHFLPGNTTPTSGLSMRHKFTETEAVYVSYWVKYSSNWQGSNKPYHPHEFYLLTNKNGDWTGPAYTHLTAYIEQNEGEPLLSIQDGQNIDESNIGVDLTGITEDRAVAGCNGDSDGYGEGDCYSVGSHHANGKSWRAGNIFFQDTLGLYYKNDWHFIEAYIKLNSIMNGIAAADGTLKYWYDGNLIINHTDVIVRTGSHPDMKFNQFIIGPWIGDGSPVEQVMWVDDLTVAGNINTVDVTNTEQDLPGRFQLNQNYPNPFNSTTKINYRLSKSGKVNLSVYNLYGEKVAVLVKENKHAGKNTAAFDAKNLPSGVYFYQLKLNNSIESRKMILLK